MWFFVGLGLGLWFGERVGRAPGATLVERLKVAVTNLKLPLN